MAAPVILGADGLPLARPKARALAGNGGPAYDAAHGTSAEMAGWNPSIGTPDGELRGSRDTIVARVRDLVRNDGWASGGLTRILDSVIGPGLRCKPKPDFRSLAWYSTAFDAKWAAEFSSQASALWRDWANNPGKWCDAARGQTVPQMVRLAFRHKLVDGDALAVLRWMPERRGYGRADYATALQLVDPDRLGNPQGSMDTLTMRGGVEVDADGAAVAYHFRRAHPAEWAPGAEKYTWDRVPRETDFGRPIVVHDFEMDRIGQKRGGAGVLSPVLARMRMLAKYDSAELQASIVNAIFGAFIESPNDPELVQQALNGDDPDGKLSTYQEGRAEFHADSRLKVGDVRLPMLFPGERIGVVNAARPSGNYASFEGAVLRNVASAMGLSAPQLSQDWGGVNYSSARAALLEAWKTLSRRRADFAAGFCAPIYAAFLEEAMDRNLLPLPAGAPDYVEERAAYARADWTGPGRGWVDPVKEKQGAVLGIANYLSTLEREAAENGGEDWEDLLDQRAIEIARMKELGLPDPLGARVMPIMKNSGGPGSITPAEEAAVDAAEGAEGGDEE